MMNLGWMDGNIRVTLFKTTLNNSIHDRPAITLCQTGTVKFPLMTANIERHSIRMFMLIVFAWMGRLVFNVNVVVNGAARSTTLVSAKISPYRVVPKKKKFD